MKNQSQKTRTALPLSDAALVLLSHAANRDDGMLLPPPASLHTRGGALQKVLAGLLRKGLVEERSVRTAEQAWCPAEDCRHIGLKITTSGLTAIGVPALSGTGTSPDAPSQADAPASGDPAGSKTEDPSSGRLGSKQALLIAELRRPEGARIDDLTGLLGWQPHTVRAALTGLRRKGVAIERSQDGEGKTVYRALPSREESTPPAEPAAKRQRKQGRPAKAPQPVEA